MLRIKKTLTTIGVWLGIQLTVMIPFAIYAATAKKEMTEILAPSLFVSNALVILVLWFMRYYKIRELFQKVPIKVLVLSLVLGFCALYAIDILSLPFNLPDIMGDLFNYMAHTFWGFLAIAIIGPIAEEVMMRRVILTEIAQSTGKQWLGILISAALFAIIHGNPIQIFFALPAGILLGWLYCKTGNLLVPICVHIMNNTISFFTIRSGAENDMQFTDTWTLVQLSACIVVTIALVIWLNVYYSKNKIEVADLEEQAVIADAPQE